MSFGKTLEFRFCCSATTVEKIKAEMNKLAISATAVFGILDASNDSHEYSNGIDSSDETYLSYNDYDDLDEDDKENFIGLSIVFAANDNIDWEEVTKLLKINIFNSDFTVDMEGATIYDMNKLTTIIKNWEFRMGGRMIPSSFKIHQKCYFKAGR